jgi:hypothetical protein
VYLVLVFSIPSQFSQIAVQESILLKKSIAENGIINISRFSSKWSIDVIAIKHPNGGIGLNGLLRVN